MSYIREKSIQKKQFLVDTASFTKQTVSATVVGYSGTEIAYTPEFNSSSVVYEVNFTVAWNPDGQGSYPCTRIQYSSDNGSSWNTISGTELLQGTFSSQIDYDWINMSYTHILDTWSGERKIRLAGRAHTSNQEFIIGRQWYGSNAEGVSCCPHVSIYSVTS